MAPTVSNPSMNNQPLAHIHIDNIQAILDLASVKTPGSKTMTVMKDNA